MIDEQLYIVAYFEIVSLLIYFEIVMFKRIDILIEVRIYFLVQLLLSKWLHIHSLDICKLF